MRRLNHPNSVFPEDEFSYRRHLKPANKVFKHIGRFHWADAVYFKLGIGLCKTLDLRRKVGVVVWKNEEEDGFPGVLDLRGELIRAIIFGAD
jgi:hypothetical protein